MKTFFESLGVLTFTVIFGLAIHLLLVPVLGEWVAGTIFGATNMALLAFLNPYRNA